MSKSKIRPVASFPVYEVRAFFTGGPFAPWSARKGTIDEAYELVELEFCRSNVRAVEIEEYRYPVMVATGWRRWFVRDGDSYRISDVDPTTVTT